MTAKKDKKAEYCIAMTTCASMEQAEDIISALLDGELAACIQVVNIESYYKWKRRINLDHEKLLIIKTRTALYKDVEFTIRKTHEYNIPEIICVPILEGFKKYLGWIDEVTE